MRQLLILIVIQWLVHLNHALSTSSRRISLLDQAVALYSQCTHSPHSVDFLADQATSLVQVLATCPSSTEIALQIDQAILQRQSVSTVEALLERYVDAKQSGVKFDVIECQLRHYQQLVASLPTTGGRPLSVSSSASQLETTSLDRPIPQPHFRVTVVNASSSTEQVSQAAFSSKQDEEELVVTLKESNKVLFKHELLAGYSVVDKARQGGLPKIQKAGMGGLPTKKAATKSTMLQATTRGVDELDQVKVPFFATMVQQETTTSTTGTGRRSSSFPHHAVGTSLARNQRRSFGWSSSRTRVQDIGTTALHATISDDYEQETVDIAIVGAGLAGLCAGAILNTLYGKKVGIYESHYLAGGCAHAFERRAANGVDFTFDSGPTILLGCSSPPYNALRQVLDSIGQSVDWIPYNGWGMIEHPGKENESRWRVELGPDRFESGPLQKFGGETAAAEYRALQEATKGLLAGSSIPAMAMRPGPQALFPLLRYIPTLISLLSQGETTTGTFAPFMDGPIFTVTNPWLRDWLDALAFSLSGLPASRTAAASMAFVLSDMHRQGAALDYPKGGMGEIVEALVRGVEQGSNGSKVHLRQHVQSIDCSPDATEITGITLSGGKQIRARKGVICNAPVWSLKDLIHNDQVLERLNSNVPLGALRQPKSSWKTGEQGSSIRTSRKSTGLTEDSLLAKCDTAEQTGSFLHLHLALNATGLDLSSMEAHYTVMDVSTHFYSLKPSLTPPNAARIEWRWNNRKRCIGRSLWRAQYDCSFQPMRH
jgi:hypothetical protein